MQAVARLEICTSDNANNHYILYFKIKSLLHKLPLNRAAGKDGIFAEHIFYADSSVCNHLSSLFNVCLMHGKIPQECMQTVIVPICKNKNGNISDAENYRPVSLATIISKLFEHYILSCISPLLATTDNQFDFKQKHGTDMCIFLLKQTVSYYVNKDTPVFSPKLREPAVAWAAVNKTDPEKYR